MKYLVASLVGAIIGYFTNWLAIKMLFRPHQEKRILGFKMPFTPGLIPKERERIAKSVGETVGTHLLTDDAIKKALSGEKMNKQLQLWINNNIENLKNSRLTIGENIKNLTGKKYIEVTSSMADKLRELMVPHIRSEKTREKVILSIEDYIMEELKVSPKDLLEQEYSAKLKLRIIDKIEEIKSSLEFKEILRDYINTRLKELELSDKCINEVVPDSILAGIKSYIYNSRAEISSGIGEMLKQPDIEDRIKKVISSIISSNLSPMIAMFINPDVIYGKLSSSLQEYLLEDENQRNVALTINQGFEKIIKNNMSELFSKLDLAEKEKGIEDITELIIRDVITKDLMTDIIVNIQASLMRFQTLDEILKAFDKGYAESLKNLISDKIHSFMTSDKFEEMASNLVSEGMESIMLMKVSDLVGKDEEIISSIAMNVAREVFERFVENEASGMVEALNIPQIVEERINSFDVEFTENIIIDIANKELNAITWLGALLGGLIGIISPILQNFY
jgi:uncharacterized membrane protein YheB (UPF0754 family)